MMVAMPAVIWLLAPGFTDDKSIFDLAVTFGRITFPYLVFISLASLYGGVLNGIDRFAEVAFTPVLLNLALIGACSASRRSCPTPATPLRSASRSRACCNGCGCCGPAARDGVGMKLGAAALHRAGAAAGAARHAGGDRRRRAAGRLDARRGLGLAAAGRFDLGALLRRSHHAAAARRDRHRHRHGAAAAARPPAPRRRRPTRRWPTRTAPSSSACCSACPRPPLSGSWPSR